MIPWLTQANEFPAPDRALSDPNGLLAAGGALSVEWLLTAYRQGIFPWYLPGEPILWWSPDPRMVLLPTELHVSRSLEKALRNRSYVVRYDTAFDQVIDACAAPRKNVADTWIGPEVKTGYRALHEAGFAHSVETWMDGELVGGLYGVAIGQIFYGESMFAHQPDASKIAFVHLVRWLARMGFALIDCQMQTHHLARFGAREISRREFCSRLAEGIAKPGVSGRWRYEDVGSGIQS